MSLFARDRGLNVEENLLFEKGANGACGVDLPDGGGVSPHPAFRPGGVRGAPPIWSAETRGRGTKNDGLRST